MSVGNKGRFYTATTTDTTLILSKFQLIQSVGTISFRYATSMGFYESTGDVPGNDKMTYNLICTFATKKGTRGILYSEDSRISAIKMALGRTVFSLNTRTAVCIANDLIIKQAVECNGVIGNVCINSFE